MDKFLFSEIYLICEPNCFLFVCFLVFFIFIVALTLKQRAIHQAPLSQNLLLFDTCLNLFQGINVVCIISQSGLLVSLSHIWTGVSPDIL